MTMNNNIIAIIALIALILSMIFLFSALSYG